MPCILVGARAMCQDRMVGRKATAIQEAVHFESSDPPIAMETWKPASLESHAAAAKHT